MKGPRLSSLGAGIVVAAVSGCAAIDLDELPQASVLQDDQTRVLPVSFREPSNNGRFQHGNHSHMFPEKFVGDTETNTFMHLPLSHRDKLMYLGVRQRHLKTLLQSFRKYLSESIQIRYELELRMIPDEQKRLRRELQEALHRLNTTDEL